MARTVLDHEGWRLAYLESGAGHPLLWLHAFPLTADMWTPQLGQPPAGWRVIAPDLRGFGASPHPGALSIDEHAHDVLRLMDRLGLDSVVLGGLSMGGYVALAVARRAAHRLRALVLADTRSEADSPDARDARERMQRTARDAGPAAIAEIMVPRLLSASTLAEQSSVAEFVRQTIASNSSDAIVAALECLKTRPDATPSLPFITVPTLLLVGEQDAITPPAAHEALRERIPRSTLVVVPRAGHLSNLEQPELFNAAVETFIARVS